jgi:phage tail-like protein
MPGPADPLTAARFRVEIDGLTASDFTEVLFPEAALVGGREQLTHLVLRRGAGTDRQLSDWWQEATAGKPASRAVSVVLLDARGQALARWNFRGAQPVRYALSGLNAAAPAVLIESIELAVENFGRQ